MGSDVDHESPDGKASGARPPDGDWLGTPFLRFERRGALAFCTVDRPEARNALTAAMYFGLRYAVDLVNRDPELAGLLITGSGDIFIPGGDLGHNAPDDWGGPMLFGMDNTPFDAIRHSRKPVVSAVNGIAQGGGLLIAIMSDLAVASDRATFRAPEVYRGIADTGYAQYLPAQIGPARAKDMLYTGRVVTAAEALDWGLVARVVPHEEVQDVALEALRACCRGAPEARADVKRVIATHYGSYDRMTMDKSVYGSEAREGWLAFSQRRNPEWVPEDLRTSGRL
ncbi:enoyl-CoA hydratase/isomerase family protein [Pseudofrankia inefficax]|uniref:Enoyl-CoA hydratase/isomerase n=1 Tax=Pseudofrankia inefficax (strain DSM 45817 / CECT 9037 / DDB 130130 / EuI1c) TaxID=298654 RepID=E3IVS5_PSEI1|nr:enoyl-CoA hydratase/isomerase family protein [Pseudofrankia inefficax]ADP83727.1 Enoyl-CoA hydratase/isomerase [Pseudofrankia inefficax]